jgi:triacylglycerol lipase
MSPRRRRLLIAVCVVVLVGLAAGLFRLSGIGRTARPAVPQGRPGAVLLVAGYGGATSSLAGLAAALRAAGRSVQVVPPVGNGTGDLRVQAERLKAAADRAVAAGQPSVDVIGYSAGGVVARIWYSELGGDRVARRVVTLGSPHHGTQVAGLAAGLAAQSCPVACRQLVPNSPLLDELSVRAIGKHWISVWTAGDTVVTPPDSARLAGALNIELQAVCPDARLDHGQLPADPLVLGLVGRALGPAGLTAVPTAADCAQLRGPTR